MLSLNNQLSISFKTTNPVGIEEDEPVSKTDLDETNVPTETIVEDITHKAMLKCGPKWRGFWRRLTTILAGALPFVGFVTGRIVDAIWEDATNKHNEDIDPSSEGRW